VDSDNRLTALAAGQPCEALCTMTRTRWKRRWLKVTIYKPPSLFWLLCYVICNCFLQILSLFSATECCKNYAPGIQSVTSDYSIGMFQGESPRNFWVPREILQMMGCGNLRIYWNYIWSFPCCPTNEELKLFVHNSNLLRAF